MLGLLMGMGHAFEADHIAAVSSIAAQKKSPRQIIASGAIWGFGHTITLLAIVGGVIGFGFVASQTLNHWLELLVGVMLIGLGGHVIYTMVRERVHFHSHNHHVGGQSTIHFHAHSHSGQSTAHDTLNHTHNHPEGFPFKSLLVGMMHGMAGSAALLVIFSSTLNSAAHAFAYILLFGVGSIVGMALLSSIIAVPLSWSARTLTWANRGLQGAIGMVSIIIGVFITSQQLAVI